MRYDVNIDNDSIVHKEYYLQQSSSHSILFRFALDQQA